MIYLLVYTAPLIPPHLLESTHPLPQTASLLPKAVGARVSPNCDLGTAGLLFGLASNCSPELTLSTLIHAFVLLMSPLAKDHRHSQEGPKRRRK